MRFTSISVAAAALLASTATALPTVSARKAQNTSTPAYANVIAINHPISGESSQTPVKIPFGELTHFEDLPITGFQLDGITVTAKDLVVPDEDQVVCQRYRDQYGIMPGSALFNTTTEALVSTNSVDFGWVLCYVQSQS
ncbi:Fc.00g084460.m01.CDS01 [Cosmosporella sp. VM-42]